MWPCGARRVDGPRGEGTGYGCCVCDAVLPSSSRYAKHRKIHEQGVAVYECSYPGCDGSYSRRDHLKRHMMTHQGVKPYQCAKCDATFITRDKLVRHGETHKPRPLLSCPHCTRTFYRPTYLERHVATHTNTLIHTIPKILSPLPDSLSCIYPSCKRSFSDAAERLRHIQSYHTCPYPGCSTLLSKPSNIAAHITAQHSSAPPSYMCPHLSCGASFSYKGAMTRHYRKQHHSRREQKRVRAYWESRPGPRVDVRTQLTSFTADRSQSVDVRVPAQEDE